jgi:Cdc6-like AAA superfamily ATPase
MSSRLELQSYSRLVGIEDPKNSLLEALTDHDDYFIVALDGLGGIGKTALADLVTRTLLKTTHFDEIAWITAKHTHLSTLGRLQIESGRPALTFPMLIDMLSKQFELSGNEKLSQLERQRLVQQYLREKTCMIVIDNLETVSDYHNLLPELRKWQNPSKFFLTSRLRLLDEQGVFSLSMKELSEESTFELIRLEAGRTGFSALAKASEKDLKQIYIAVGGNPLAIKLIIGQLRFHSLSYVLERFTQSDSRMTEAGIFDYIYREIWESLHEQSKIVLLTLTQAGETGFSLEHLVKVSNFSERVVSTNLEKLILLSLVDLAGNLLDRRYRLHRLTEVFLLKIFSEE